MCPIRLSIKERKKKTSAGGLIDQKCSINADYIYKRRQAHGFFPLTINRNAFVEPFFFPDFDVVSLSMITREVFSLQWLVPSSHQP